MVEEVGGADQHALRVGDEEHRPPVVGGADRHRGAQRQPLGGDDQVAAARRPQPAPLEAQPLAQAVAPHPARVDHQPRGHPVHPAALEIAQHHPRQAAAGAAHAVLDLRPGEQVRPPGAAGGGHRQGQPRVVRPRVEVPHRPLQRRGTEPRRQLRQLRRLDALVVRRAAPQPIVEPQPELDLPTRHPLVLVDRVDEAQRRHQVGAERQHAVALARRGAGEPELHLLR